MTNPTDRELLMLAAKAAGVVGEYHALGIYTQNPKSAYWNPLVSDADAFRLAVDLHLTCRFYMGNTCAQSTVPGGPSVMVDEHKPDEPIRAARRAIVRAAAAIGERQ